MSNFRAKLCASIFCAAFVLSPFGASAENRHITAAVSEAKEAIAEGRQHLYSSFSEHTYNALDHAKEAIASGYDPKGHVKTAVKHLRSALKIAKGTHHSQRLAKGIRETEKALIHLKVANEY
jgi:3-hydroxyisobutyrate dehydrogenase-like beta-hydroxyacid dehydrogenase